MSALGALSGGAAGVAGLLRLRRQAASAPAAGLASSPQLPPLKCAAVPDAGQLVWGRQLRPTLLLPSQAARKQQAPRPPAAAAEEAKPAGFLDKYPALVTGFFFFMWYFLNVIFNILNKKIYNYFPYPYFVSAIHLVVGVVYCLISWSLGLPKRAPVNAGLLKLLFPVALCHALGHVTSNVSFAAVAVSFAHTIKALEPFFNAAATQFILGQQVPLSLWLSLAPVVIGVSMASLTELSFNWTGFINAMISNISFTYRSIYSKKAMTDMDSTNVYAYISIIALIVCIPPAVIFEGPQLMQHGFKDAIAKVGVQKLVSDLFLVGLFYHLYNQVATNTLERVAPLTHAVGNVLKRVFVIGFSIIVFGNRITTQTGIGTCIAIAGVAMYSYIKAKIEEEKRVSFNSWSSLGLLNKPEYGWKHACTHHC
ncbi:hypothetical protein HU200_066798 [Digitaria exilis]|uniref:Sugar phosphate transporter domain-containing protein n=1 Tax=Digitaria exilis TaxID=1010633 RepID=A0A835DWX2_9POAL|nr:hypothetical protein HU200_066798 [Digitaria exilis]